MRLAEFGDCSMLLLLSFLLEIGRAVSFTFASICLGRKHRCSPEGREKHVAGPESHRRDVKLFEWDSPIFGELWVGSSLLQWVIMFWQNVFFCRWFVLLGSIALWVGYRYAYDWWHKKEVMSNASTEAYVILNIGSLVSVRCIIRIESSG